jgi:hypothetical protein
MLQVISARWGRGDKVLGRGELDLRVDRKLNPRATERVYLFDPETHDPAGEVSLLILERTVVRISCSP